MLGRDAHADADSDLDAIADVDERAGSRDRRTNAYDDGDTRAMLAH